MAMGGGSVAATSSPAAPRQMSYGHRPHSRLEAINAMATADSPRASANSLSVGRRASLGAVIMVDRAVSNATIKSFAGGGSYYGGGPRSSPRQQSHARRAFTARPSGRRSAAGGPWSTTPSASANVVDRRRSVYSTSERTAAWDRNLAHLSHDFSTFAVDPDRHRFVSQTTLASSSRQPSHYSRGDVDPDAAAAADWSPYKLLLWEQENDEIVQRQMALGKRIGFYKFKSDLGTGNFSKVKLATNLLTKDRVAVKLIDKTKLDAKTQRMLMREIAIMDKLAHPCLIRLYEVSETMTGLQLIMEYAPGGELFARLTEEGYYDEPKAKFIFAQVTSAVEYMHENLFIHRDLKAENVFFSAGQNQVKVGDFGFATEVNKIDQQLNTFCGSPPYAAPELFQDDHYLGPSVDIWALGILLYFMVTGSMPFKGSSVAALKHAILDGKFDLPDFLSADCIDVITGILRRKPEWRLTMSQIRESRFLSGVPWHDADYVYQSLPTKPRPRPDGSRDDLSHYETVVRDKLDRQYGISAQTLESHVERGPKSPVIGAFRILMHKEVGGGPEDSHVRLQDADGEDNYTNGYDNSRNSFSNPLRPFSRPSPHAASEGSRGRNGVGTANGHSARSNVKKKSKMCNLL